MKCAFSFATVFALFPLETRCLFFSAEDIKQEAGGYREGPPYQRRGSLQLWQFLVALLDNPTNSHFIAWTGRGMEFKLIEPEEVKPFRFSTGTDTVSEAADSQVAFPLPCEGSCLPVALARPCSESGFLEEVKAPGSHKYQLKAACQFRSQQCSESNCPLPPLP